MPVISLCSLRIPMALLGPMVVVAEASARVGAIVDVLVNRVVPSSGGRMIFGRLAEPGGTQAPVEERRA